jgi:hypothetical protein
VKVSRPIPEPIFVVQTSWPKIRFALYRREDGFFQYFEQHWRAEGWETNSPSGIFESEQAAREAMVYETEDFENT